MYPKSIQKLIDQFSKFPTVGPRTASRFVFYLLGLGREEIEDLTSSIVKLKESIKICSFCYKPFELSEENGNLCEICKNPARNRTLLCIIEKETDLLSLEKTSKYNGLYFILGGTVSNLKKDDIKKLRTAELQERIKNPGSFGIVTQFKEVILAINPTTEGEATVLYMERLLKPLNTKITRLGRGLPFGGELEYADQETLSSALESRR